MRYRVRMLRTLLVLTLFTATAAAEAPKFEIENGLLKVPFPVTFDTNKATLKAESAEAIAYVAAYLEAKSYISTMRVEVHTDAQGDDKYNQAMSEKRAFAVAKALVAKGVDCKRLIPVGFGETKPIADNTTAEGRAANRRTAFANAALRGKPIGGMPLDGGGAVAGDPCK
jgi:OmpA-OmpF porin, OOP family